MLGLRIEPDGIHVIHAETNVNIYEGVITAVDKVAFADGEFDLILLNYIRIDIDNNNLYDKDGKINAIGSSVTVKSPLLCHHE